MRKCILIKTNLEFEVVELPEDDTFNDEVYKLLDCECWEGVPGVFETYLMVDESGKLKRPPKKENLLACSLYAGFIFGEDVLVGDVLVSTIGKNEDGESDLVSLSDRKLECIMAFLLSAKSAILKIVPEEKR